MVTYSSSQEGSHKWTANGQHANKCPPSIYNNKYKQQQNQDNLIFKVQYFRISALCLLFNHTFIIHISKAMEGSTGLHALESCWASITSAHLQLSTKHYCISISYSKGSHNPNLKTKNMKCYKILMINYTHDQVIECHQEYICTKNIPWSCLFIYLFISLIHVAQTGLKGGKCDLKLLSHNTQVSMVLGMKTRTSSVTCKHFIKWDTFSAHIF